MGEVIPFPKRVMAKTGEDQSYNSIKINKSLISYLRLGLGDYMVSLPNQPEVLLGIDELFKEVLNDMNKRSESR